MLLDIGLSPYSKYDLIHCQAWEMPQVENIWGAHFTGERCLYPELVHLFVSAEDDKCIFKIHYCNDGEHGAMQADMVLEKELRVMYLDPQAVDGGAEWSVYFIQ
ncbi:hypothetical protein STEG23_034457, partial [Scotinomys teguina]